MKNKRSNYGYVFLLALVFLAGVYASWTRFTKGLGASTNLSDEVPWGLWIWIFLARIALSSGGFILCMFFYIFRVKQVKPFLRASVLTAFIGYALGGIDLIYDLGLPHHFWHPLFMWNFQSVMLETTWCIALYFLLVCMELSIPVSEGFGLNRLSGLLKNFVVVFAIVGAVLSTLHQSSLGALFLLAKEKLSGFWHSPLLPILFLSSSIAGGLSFLVLELSLAKRFFKWELSLSAVKFLARTLLTALLLHLFLEIADLIHQGKWVLFAQETKASFWFSLEIITGVLLPIALLSFKRVRETHQGLRLSALLTVVGLFLNRLNVTVIGFLVKSNARYFPSWQEFSIAIMFFTVGIILFFAFARRFPILEKEGWN